MEYRNDYLVEDDNVIDIDLNWDDSNKNDIPIDIHVDSISDGLIYSLRNLGRVDIEYIAKISDSSIDLVIERLKGSIYQDPENWDGCYYKGFKTSDDYLSGNLIKKLRKAKYANLKYNGRFDENIKALEETMPKGISLDEIYYSLSSSWIPKHIIEEFFDDEFLYRYYNAPGIAYNNNTNQWEIKVPSNKIKYAINYRFATKRISALKIFEHLINSKNIAIYDSLSALDKNSKKKLNKEETTLALNKAHELNNFFKDYLSRKTYLLDELVEAYNDKFGYSVSRVYNGDFLEFKNMNKSVSLFKSQKDAIARIIFNNNTLLAHNVGAGKTYIMIAAGEELLRMGLSKKNLYVVPNNIVTQWENDYKYLYPNSNVLVTNTKDYTPAKVKETLKKIKDENNKAIIIPHSSFDNLIISRIEQMNEILDKINQLNSKNSDFALKQIRNLKESYKKLEDLGDDYISFKELGVTRLFVDEAHNYKNIAINTNRGYIKGINLDGSKKCVHLESICEYMNSFDDNGIIMATGTPISNSISDIYSIQTYLQKGQLKLLDINTFDDWLNMFTEESDEFEIDLDSTKYRPVKRLSKFHNLPELTTILSNIAAFYYDSNKVGLPKFNGYKDILVPKSIELKEYIENLSKRLDLIRDHSVDLKDDNLLKITMDGRRAALDLRLIDEEQYKYCSTNKVKACAKEVYDMYLKSNDFKGTQLIFCDTSVPSKSFNIYDELKRTLVNYGIKADEIVYIHDAVTDKAKEELFNDMNNGNIRILIGSTQKLGTGVNVQDRLCAIHHLDIPWRPSDMIQREGRILRIGNKCNEVFIYRYITEGSFDSYSWQILENKQKFICELLNNSLNERTKEDIEESVLSYGEVKALAIGNPKLQEHVKLKNKISKLRLLQKKYKDSRALMKRELLEIPNQIENLNTKIDLMEKDIKYLNSNNNISYSKEERSEIRKKIWDSLINNIGNKSEVEILDYYGFKIKAPANLISNNLYLLIENNNRYTLDLGNSDLGVISRIDNFFEKLSSKLADTKSKRDDLLIKKESIAKELENEIDYSSEIIRLNEELNILEKELDIDE